ncbi:hypothetical protein K493DRAFT_315442 [Basidiobolus meristosporus CBS 931.73]|uniref:CASTOR ACT domain-containing protein n=1 Tax=Basidiobolus meristosporus CBS 931.73 TaxID=1314790 RepID=A0A1Y1XUJ4_9FUNG|nr:hypothetical protein K493DRAFT_318689 [Basidiobolus meristosporus CBS 931.73]ORX94525.1 hypothetical protein K493DRAFT_315442 [Basidiobolus meristosporus CBS 931.73]|eukprot:ORX89429.1 hypothetical protein K493DRAFT_318689 [Basidiobolus meristosporus CBS 931.73]
MNISILPARVRILSFPISSRPLWTHAIVKNTFFPSRRDSFFSYTENVSEISIIADVVSVEKDFLQSPALKSTPGIKICEDIFRVLEIDNAYGMELNSRRINELTGPLARAGISIFYLSTYQTDYFLIKEKRIPFAVETLQACGFDFIDLDTVELATPPESPFPMEIPAGSFNLEQPPTSLESMENLGNGNLLEQDIIVQVRRQCTKIVTKHKLRLVGLDKEYRDNWAMTLIRILLYPELEEDFRSTKSRFVSFTATEDGISLIVEESVLAQFEHYMINMSLTRLPMRLIQIDLSIFVCDRYGIVHSMSNPLSDAGINLIYLSTTQCANVLVEEDHLPIAQQILEALDTPPVTPTEQELGKFRYESHLVA